MKISTKEYSNEDDLLSAFKRGEREAFIAVYEKYWEQIFLIAYRTTGRKDVAEDLVQNLFLKLWEKRGVLEIRSLGSYLYSSIKHSCLDYIQGQVVRNDYAQYQKSMSPDSEPTTERMVEASNLQERIEESLTRLPEKSRDVFKLNRIDQWPVDKIAEKLNISEKAVQYHITKSLKLMRVYLKSIIFTLSVLPLG